MKRISLIATLSLLFCIPLVALAETRERGLHFKLSGGIGSFNVGDFNTFFGDTVPYYDSILSSYGFTRQGGYEELRRARSGSGEIVIDLFKIFSAGVEIGYHQMDSPSSISWSHTEDGDLNIDLTSSLNVVPIKLNVYAALPLTSGIRTYLHGGFGIHTVQSTFEYREDTRIPENEGYFRSEIRAKGTGYGIHGGLGLELEISSAFAVFAEGSYRSVKLNDLDGRMSTRANSPIAQTVGGKIWYFQFFDENSSSNISGISVGEKPEEEGLNTLREFEIDLSGYSLKVGFRIRFALWN